MRTSWVVACAVVSLAACGGRMETDGGPHDGSAHDGTVGDGATDAGDASMDAGDATPPGDLGGDASDAMPPVDMGGDASDAMPPVDMGDDASDAMPPVDMSTTCAVPSDCPGSDGPCAMRQCLGGTCSMLFVASGDPAATQTPGDCQLAVCDGAGASMNVPDDTDVGSDGNDCTTDGCSAGVPTFTPVASGTACASGGGMLCDASGTCVQCLLPTDCPGTDTECSMRACGGGVCSTANAPNGTPLAAQTPGDCRLAACDGAGGTTALPDDTDVGSDGNDCTTDGCATGTPTFTPVALGTPCATGGGRVCSATGTCVACNADADCAGSGGLCVANACVRLLISQIQTRGSAGGNDEFVEIYNAGSAPVTFDSSWIVQARSAVGVCTTAATAMRFAGTGQVIPSHGHLLYANAAAAGGYDGPTAADATYTTGITDGSSVMLVHAGTVADALCFYFDAATQTNLTTCATPYVCEGTPIMNVHNNTTATNTDASLERLPGGALGNATDTGNNATDFAPLTTSTPRDLASPPAP